MELRPKVLFIMHMPPPVHGAAMVGKRIHDSKLINEEFDCHYINLATAKDLQDIGKFRLNKLFDFFDLLKIIRRTVLNTKPDLVYVTPNACGGAFYKDFVVIQLLKLLGCRILLHYHNKGVSNRQNYWLDNCLYKHFFPDTKVMLLAPALYKDMEKYLKKEQVFYCPNGNPESIDYEPSAERNNTVPIILFLSNLIISKGVLVLLDALAILKQKKTDFFCNFVGGETAELDKQKFDLMLMKRGLVQCVSYEGRKYDKEKEIYFKSADIFVFPSFYGNETFGLVNLEAMEWKLPIISTDEGGIPDVVKDGENGLIVPCRRENGKNIGPRAEELALAIEKLIKDPDLRHQMGEDGYKKYKKNFTLSSFENKFIEGINWAMRQ